MHSSASSEWFTPDVILDRAKQVLGRIDLDPASCEAANRRVEATEFFTKEQDGLSQNWNGAHTIFLNPPGDKRGALPKAFWNKLRSMTCAYGFQAGIYVGFSLEQLRYLEGIKNASTAIIKQRVKYLRPDGSVGESPAHGSFVSFIGEESYGNKFYSVFSDISNVVYL